MSGELIEAIMDYTMVKNLEEKEVLITIEHALIKAYKKNYGASGNVRIDIDADSGDINVYITRKVVEVVSDDTREISLEEALKYNPDCTVGHVFEYLVTPKDFERVAALTASEVMRTKLHELERSKKK